MKRTHLHTSWMTPLRIEWIISDAPSILLESTKTIPGYTMCLSLMLACFQILVPISWCAPVQISPPHGQTNWVSHIFVMHKNGLPSNGKRGYYHTKITILNQCILSCHQRVWFKQVPALYCFSRSALKETTLKVFGEHDELLLMLELEKKNSMYYCPNKVLLVDNNPI